MSGWIDIFRRALGWLSSGAEEEVVVGSVVEIQDSALYTVEIEDTAVYEVALSNSGIFGVGLANDER